MSPAVVRRALLIVLVLAVLAALATTVAGAVLADVYRPGVAFGEPVDRSPVVVRSDAWTTRHELAAGALAVTTAVAAALSLVVSVRGVTTRQAVLLVAGPVLGFGAAVLTILSRSAAAWDQVALWAVAPGQDLSGYWFAAFDDGVRFVVLDGTEVSQGAYLAGLVVHLAAPVVGVIVLAPALVVAAGLARRSRPSEPDVMASSITG